ncbi:MAG TPA: hypothetical protein PKC21_07070 [Oligoflexia bacterium]|nr:hypothetical protein [Oligoflexia bacterium]HMR25098.1 hypothetical protein [Oligoflexia bacterium]
MKIKNIIFTLIVFVSSITVYAQSNDSIPSSELFRRVLEVESLEELNRVIDLQQFYGPYIEAFNNADQSLFKVIEQADISGNWNAHALYMGGAMGYITLGDTFNVCMRLNFLEDQNATYESGCDDASYAQWDLSYEISETHLNLYDDGSKLLNCRILNLNSALEYMLCNQHALDGPTKNFSMYIKILQ